MTSVYLKVANGWGPEDLNVGGVGVGQRLPVSEPHDRHIAGMSLDFTSDIDGVSLPGVHRDLTVDLW